jgi:MFS family permease
VASAVTARRADRWATPPIAIWWTLALAIATGLPAVLLGVPATLVFLIGASVATGVIVALTFPFGLQAVTRGAVTVAVMSALANIIWALSGMAGPTVGGAFAEVAGDRAAFAVLALACVLVIAMIMRGRVSDRASKQEGRSPHTPTE